MHSIILYLVCIPVAGVYMFQLLYKHREHWDEDRNGVEWESVFLRVFFYSLVWPISLNIILWQDSK